jgi:hypothetical protein
MPTFIQLTTVAPNWRSGSGVPSSGLGNDGDWYLNTSTSDVYGPKTGAGWGAIVTNIKGAPGGTGLGDPGANGIVKRTALNTTTTAGAGSDYVAPGGSIAGCTGLALTTGVTGILPVVNGGSGSSSPALVAGTNVTITGSWPNQTINSSGGGGGATVVAATTTLTPGAIVDGGVYEATFTLTGAVAGEAVVPQWPADFQTGLIGTMIASATNTIKVRIFNAAGISVTPTAGGTYGAKVLH